MADGSIIIDALISLKDFKKDLKKFDSLISAGMKGATVAIGAITTGMGIASKKALEFGTEYSKASNQLQAELGATADEMENGKSKIRYERCLFRKFWRKHGRCCGCNWSCKKANGVLRKQ